MKRREPRDWSLPDNELFQPVVEEDERVADAIWSVARGGVDLSGRETELRRLLRELPTAHDMALEDYERRYDPDKPLPGMVPRVEPPGDGRVFDFGEHAGGGLEDADEYWEEHLKRPPGAPKVTPAGVQTAGLHEVFKLVRMWWLDNVPGARGFNPDFGRTRVGWKRDESGEYIKDKTGRRQPIFDYYIQDDYNGPAWLLLCLASELDRRYKPEVLHFQYESFKRRAGRQKKQKSRRAGPEG